MEIMVLNISRIASQSYNTVSKADHCVCYLLGNTKEDYSRISLQAVDYFVVKTEIRTHRSTQ